MYFGSCNISIFSPALVSPRCRNRLPKYNGPRGSYRKWRSLRNPTQNPLAILVLRYLLMLRYPQAVLTWQLQPPVLPVRDSHWSLVETWLAKTGLSSGLNRNYVADIPGFRSRHITGLIPTNPLNHQVWSPRSRFGRCVQSSQEWHQNFGTL